MQGMLNRQQLTKLAAEATTLAEWTTIRDFATQMYGEGKVAKVEIETYGEYDDEGGTDYRIEDITAYDKDGNTLRYDLRLPFFTSALWNDRNYYDDWDEDFEDDEGPQCDLTRKFMNIYLWRAEDKQKNTFVLKGDLPVDDATYDLAVAPTISVKGVPC